MPNPCAICGTYVARRKALRYPHMDDIKQVAAVEMACTECYNQCVDDYKIATTKAAKATVAKKCARLKKDHSMAVAHYKYLDLLARGMQARLAALPAPPKKKPGKKKGR